MDDSAGTEETAVALKEKRGGEAGVLAAAELRIGEGEPDFGDLARTKEGVDELNARAQESHVPEGILRGFLRPLPQAGALDVHADEVHFRMPAGQGDGVIPLTAAQLHHDGLVLRKHIPVPVSLDGMIPQDQLLGPFRLRQYGSRVRLQQAAERLVFSKFPEFPVSHYFLRSTTRPMPRSPSSGSFTATVRVH